jgi:hypothetical protein
MNKETLLNLMKPEVKAIPLGEQTIHLAQWSLDEGDKVIAALTRYNDKEIECSEYFAIVAICSVCDESGIRIFNDSDIEVLAKSGAVKLKTIYREAMEFNSIVSHDVEDAEKN